MNLRVNKLFFVISALLLLVACGGLVERPFRSDEEPVATPDIDATVEAKVKAALTAVPTVTPVPTATPDIVATVEAKLKDALAALLVPMDAPTPTVIPTATPTVIPTATPTVIPTQTPTPTPDFVSPGIFDSQELYAKFNPSVVLVQTSSGSGSGVVIGSGKQILTAAHVVTGFSQVQIRHHDHLQRSARVVNLDTVSDLALLEVDVRISIDNYPELAKSLPAVGSSVTVIGYPLGMAPPPTITQGIISKFVSDGGVNYIQVDAAINEGNSGGPIFSENGDLLGIAVQKYKAVGVEGIAWAVGADTVRSVLPTLLVAATPSPTLVPPTPTMVDQAIFYRVQGKKEFDNGYYQQAIEHYSEAIRLSVQSPVAEDYNMRGIAYRRVGQFDKAVRDVTEAIRLNGHNSCIYYSNRALVYTDQKQWELAVLDLTEAIKELKCREARYYNRRGNASYNLGHYLDAIQDYSAAISRDPQKSVYYANRGVSYYKTEQYQSAITDLSEAIRLDPQDVSSYNFRGASYYKVQQYQAAILDFTEVILAEPDNCLSYGWRAAAYYREGKISEANRDVSTSNNLGGCSYLYPY